MKTKTLNQIGWLVSGTATLSMWGGGQGMIEMQEQRIIPKEGERLTRDWILGAVNDNGFGCESILGADIDVYDLYEGGYKEFNRTIFADHRYSDKFLGWKNFRYNV